jgi:hypothetical protein
MGWQDDKAWSARFIPQMQRHLAPLLIKVAQPDDDILRNTDLVTLEVDGKVRVACRVRRHEYLSRYGDEFTLRCTRPTGTMTEIDKVLSGWGDYLFYGFADASESDLATWFVGDLQVFREWVTRYRRKFSDWPGELRRNHDGSSAFMAFSIVDVDPRFVVERNRLTCNVSGT